MRITKVRLVAIVALTTFALALFAINSQVIVGKNDSSCHSRLFGCGRRFEKRIVDYAGTEAAELRGGGAAAAEGAVGADPGLKRDAHGVAVTDTDEDDKEETPWEYNDTERAAAKSLEREAEKEVQRERLVLAQYRLNSVKAGAQNKPADTKRRAKVPEVHVERRKPVAIKQYDNLDPDQKASSCAVILAEDGLVRTCVTKAPLGRVRKSDNYALVAYKASADHKPQEDAEDRARSFQKVFETLAWGHDWDPNQKGLNVSGMGATVPWAQEVMATLHSVINEIKQTLSISRVRLLDIPCGDMGWMSRFLKSRDDVVYTGVDIVPDLVRSHQKTYQAYPWKFIHGDVLSMVQLPGKYDLILSRTLLQHLYFKDAAELLAKFSGSGSSYLLTTTWSRHKRNAELVVTEDNPGRFRELNLELPPFYLPPPLCLQRDGPPDAYQGWDHFLGLWKLPLKQVPRCDDISVNTYLGTNYEVYSCTDWTPKN